MNIGVGYLDQQRSFVEDRSIPKSGGDVHSIFDEGDGSLSRTGSMNGLDGDQITVRQHHANRVDGPKVKMLDQKPDTSGEAYVSVFEQLEKNPRLKRRLENFSGSQLKKVFRATNGDDAQKSISGLDKFLDWFRRLFGAATSAEVAVGLYNALTQGDLDACRYLRDRLKSDKHELLVTYQPSENGDWSYTITAGGQELFNGTGRSHLGYGLVWSDEEMAKAVKQLAIETHTDHIRYCGDFESALNLCQLTDDAAERDNVKLTVKVEQNGKWSYTVFNDGAELFKKTLSKGDKLTFARPVTSKDALQLYGDIARFLAGSGAVTDGGNLAVKTAAVMSALPDVVVNNCNLSILYALIHERLNKENTNIATSMDRDLDRMNYNINGNVLPSFIFDKSDAIGSLPESEIIEKKKDFINVSLQATETQKEIIRALASQTTMNMTVDSAAASGMDPLDTARWEKSNKSRCDLDRMEDGNIRITVYAAGTWRDDDENFQEILLMSGHDNMRRPDSMKKPVVQTCLMISPGGAVTVVDADFCSGAELKTGAK